MDPNANIKRQRELAAEIHLARINDDEGAMADGAVELAELVQALDEWRRNGGFDPYLKQSPHLSERGLHEPPIPLGELWDAGCYVIAGAPGDDGTTRYWSNDGGWVHLGEATRFAAQDPEAFESAGREARWVELPNPNA